MQSSLMKRPPLSWISRHPRLAAWIILSLGMTVLLVYEARDVGLLPMQWVALVLATVLVAGLCVYIISWEDDNEEDERLPEAVPAVDKDESTAASGS
jgi:protein-S-isoprenylcysteine O-methyltransferase Ste14